MCLSFLSFKYFLILSSFYSSAAILPYSLSLWLPITAAFFYYFHSSIHSCFFSSSLHSFFTSLYTQWSLYYILSTSQQINELIILLTFTFFLSVSTSPFAYLNFVYSFLLLYTYVSTFHLSCIPPVPSSLCPSIIFTYSPFPRPWHSHSHSHSQPSTHTLLSTFVS